MYWILYEIPYGISYNTIYDTMYVRPDKFVCIELGVLGGYRIAGIDGGYYEAPSFGNRRRQGSESTEPSVSSFRVFFLLNLGVSRVPACCGLSLFSNFVCVRQF